MRLKFSLLSIFIPSSLTQFEEIILLLLMFKLIFDIKSSFLLDRNNTQNFLGSTNMLFCFNQLIASALSFFSVVFKFDEDFEKLIVVLSSAQF